MCGIAGFWEFKATENRNWLETHAAKMSAVLTHRGPDSGSVWADEQTGIALGHRRLSIIDLTEAAAQPMHSRDGRFVISFNGEIYNFREIRTQLQETGAVFRSQSDTEVLLEAITAWGLEKALTCCIGMFALALWDQKQHTLSLVRDRLGVKPLYYARVDNRALLFASQSKSFLQYPHFRPEIAPDALAEYLQFAYLPGSRSIYRSAAQVRPGHIVTVSPDGSISEAPYWTLPHTQLRIGEGEALEQLEALLESAVSLRMRSDVPVGVFLSGGIDSSLVASTMQAVNSTPVKSFCVGFADTTLDESPFAAAIAQHLGTTHTDARMGERDVLSLLPTLPDYYDEPFADYSMLPTMLVSHMAHRQVGVCLSGDGGDELFAGYSRYKAAANLIRILKLPASARKLSAPLLQRVPLPIWQTVGKMLGISATPGRVDMLTRILQADDSTSLLMEHYHKWSHELPLLSRDVSSYSQTLDSVDAMQRFDVSSYLPDDLLTKLDRASMSCGLEAREPLLDHRLVEFAFSLPLELKMRKGTSKYLLRKALAKHVPPALTERAKQGFTPPLHSWLRGPLRDWAEELLNPQALQSAGLDSNIIRSYWQSHLGGKDHTYRLWTVLMFQQWKQHYRL